MPESVGDLLGLQKGFNRICDHYYEVLSSSVYKGDLESFVLGEFPKLAPGCMTLHPLIQVGYGLTVKSKSAIVEGTFLKPVILFFNELLLVIFPHA